jgi:LuxR family maltose regulon positive regulatory protein
MQDQNPILLQTKLHRPPLPKGLLERPRLMGLLDHSTDRPLIMVCAPAGFGKTTVVSSWLEHLANSKGGIGTVLPSAWLSLDENDNDLNLFLQYVIAALRTIYSGACEATLALLQARQELPQSVLFATLSNDLEALPGECLLVLDDYHSIHSAEVHNLLAELGRHWPRALHLVLVSRMSPPMPLGTLRAKGFLSEIRTRDLRFTPEETAAYLSRSQFALMVRDVLPILEERFEGWPAGLRLATLSLRSGSSQESVLSALSSENANITGFLVDEVLTHLSPAIHTFLLKTSILDRLCAPLGEALVGETDATWSARAVLDWLERSELFVIPLDDNQEWYRYHHLFQELLQQRLSAQSSRDQVAELHSGASAWFEAHGLLDEALQHALAAGDIDLAAHHMSTGLRETTNREDRPTLERWLHLLPEELIQRRPDLLMIRAWTLEFAWRLNQQPQVLAEVEALMDSGAGTSLPEAELRIVRGQVLALRAQQAYFGNQPARAIDLSRQALALLPASWSFVRGGAMIFLGLAMQASGRAAEAERLLLDEYEACADKTDPFAMLLLRTLGFVYINSGQLEQAAQIAEALRQVAGRSGIAIAKNWADWFLGVVAYQRNDLEAAAGFFSEIAESPYTAQITAYRDAIAGLALIHQIRGQGAEARRMIEAISQFDLEQSGAEDERTRSLRARLRLLQGDLEAASAWAHSFDAPPPDRALLWLDEPQLTRARVLLARGTQADLGQALQVLEALAEIAQRSCSTRYQIEIQAMRALALEAQGETVEAGIVLRQALELSKPGGFIRVFVDLGSPMQRMLASLESQDHLGETLQRILNAFAEAGQAREVGERPTQPRRGSSPSMPGLPEPLTPREMEVLGLLRGPLSIKQIALKLGISYATAKRHAANLYAKLGVNGRWEAVAKAEELNLLPAR